MARLFQDATFAVRTLAHNAGFTVVAILTLALGIGSATAVFSVVDAVLLRPLPYENPSDLVRVSRTIPALGMIGGSLPLAVVEDLRARTRTMSVFAAEDRPRSANLLQAGPPQAVTYSQVTPGYFEALGVRTALGRILPDEILMEDGTKPVMLSYGYWQDQFGGSPEVLGTTFQLENQPIMTVVGVLPQEFRTTDLGGNTSQIWTTTGAGEASNRRFGNYVSVARLGDGQTLEAAQTEMELAMAELAQEYPETDAGFGGSSFGALVRPLKDSIVLGSHRRLTLTFGGAVGLVLVISVLNLVNLQTSRISKRLHEFSIRSALGASRAALMRQTIVEAGILTLSGAAIGLAVAYAARDVVLANTPAMLPRMSDIAIDGRVIGFGIVVALAAAVVIGIIPVLRASYSDLDTMLKDGAQKSTDTRGQHWLRSTLTTIETGLAIVLFLGAVLLLRSFSNLTSQDLGFDPDGVVTARVALTERYSDPALRSALFERLLDEVRVLPGVQAASAASGLPFEGGIGAGVRTDRGGASVAELLTVSADFGSTLNISPSVGRWISSEEVDQGVPVAVVSESAAAEMWPGETPIGHQVRWLEDGTWHTVVGVVPDLRINFSQDPFPFVYAPHSTDFLPDDVYGRHGMILAVKSTGAGAPPLTETIQRVEPDSTVTVSSMDSYIRGSVARERFRTSVLTWFAAVAILLAMLSVYSVVAYATVQRSREIGLRMALGATPRAVTGRVMRQGIVPAAGGIVVGLVASTAATRLLETYLFGIERTEPSAYLLTFVVAVALVVLASWLPARRAAHIDPIVALRHE